MLRADVFLMMINILLTASGWAEYVVNVTRGKMFVYVIFLLMFELFCFIRRSE